MTAGDALRIPSTTRATVNLPSGESPAPSRPEQFCHATYGSFNVRYGDPWAQWCADKITVSRPSGDDLRWLRSGWVGEAPRVLEVFQVGELNSGLPQPAQHKNPPVAAANLAGPRSRVLAGYRKQGLSSSAATVDLSPAPRRQHATAVLACLGVAFREGTCCTRHQYGGHPTCWVLGLVLKGPGSIKDAWQASISPTTFLNPEV